MLAARWHDESNLLALLNCAQLRWLVEHAPGKQIAVAAGDSHPHSLWAAVGDTRAAVVDDDLKVVWISR